MRESPSREGGLSSQKDGFSSHFGFLHLTRRHSKRLRKEAAEIIGILEAEGRFADVHLAGQQQLAGLAETIYD